MSEHKHTPGPWKMCSMGDSVYIKKGKRQLPPLSFDLSFFEREANARLIAAAPEMLEVLEEMARLPIAGPYPDGPCLDQADMDIVKAAIAKATGKEEA